MIEEVVVLGQVQASSQIGQSVNSRSNEATGGGVAADFTDLLLLLLLLMPLLMDDFFFFLAGGIAITDGLVPAVGLPSFLLTVIPGSTIKEFKRTSFLN